MSHANTLSEADTDQGGCALVTKFLAVVGSAAAIGGLTGGPMGAVVGVGVGIVGTVAYQALGGGSGNQPLQAPTLAPSSGNNNNTKGSPENKYGDQTIWIKGLEAASKQAKELLAQNTPFEEIMKELAEKRARIAIEQGKPDKDKFGKARPNLEGKFQELGFDLNALIEEVAKELRDKGVDKDVAKQQARRRVSIYYGENTQIDGDYAKYADSAQATMNESRQQTKNFHAWNNEDKDFLPPSLDNSELKKSDEVEGYISVGYIDGQPIELTATLFPKKTGKVGNDNNKDISQKEEEAKLQNEVSEGKTEVTDDDISPTKPPPGVWLHTACDNISKVLEHVGKLQEKLLHAKDPREGLLLLARIVWWFCHAMPYARGSASLAEWYVDACSEIKGLNLGKRIGSLDLAAFRMSEEEFCANFASFFEQVDV